MNINQIIIEINKFCQNKLHNNIMERLLTLVMLKLPINKIFNNEILIYVTLLLLYVLPLALAIAQQNSIFIFTTFIANHSLNKNVLVV